MLVVHRASVGTNANLRMGSYFMSKDFRLITTCPLFDNILTESNRKAFFSVDTATRQDDFPGTSFSDQARKPHSAAIDKRNPPSSAIDTEVG